MRFMSVYATTGGSPPHPSSGFLREFSPKRPHRSGSRKPARAVTPEPYSRRSKPKPRKPVARDPLKLLVLSVIALALDDIRDGSKEDRDKAFAWFTGVFAGLEEVAAFVGLEPEPLTQRAREAYAEATTAERRAA